MARAFDAPLQLKAVTTLGGFEKRGDLGNSGLKGSLRAGRHLNPRDFCYHGLSNERRTWPISCARPFKVRAQSPGAEYRTCLRISGRRARRDRFRSEEHTSELQSLMRISYAVFCLNTTKKIQTT